MNKQELVEIIAKNSDISKAAASKALGAFIEGVSGALKKGEAVQLVGFGTFSVVDRAARTGKNPQTGEALQIPAAKAPKFKPGKGLKDLVNGK